MTEKVKYIFYPAMVYIATRTDDDVPMAIFALKADGELCAGMVEEQHRGNNILVKMLKAVKYSVDSGKVKIPNNIIWGIAHESNEVANVIGQKLGGKVEPFPYNGATWYKWSVPVESIV